MSRINIAGIGIVQEFESCRLTAYPDPGSALFKACQSKRINPYEGGYENLPGWQRYDGGPWTIGWGHTGADVYPGLTITQDEADALLLADLEHFEVGVSALLPAYATDNQFSALVSFAFNCGLSDLSSSTLLRLFHAGDLAGAAAQFKRWNKSGGTVLTGLTRRRAAERDLFLTPGDGDYA